MLSGFSEANPLPRKTSFKAATRRIDKQTMASRLKEGDRGLNSFPIFNPGFFMIAALFRSMLPYPSLATIVFLISVKFSYKADALIVSGAINAMAMADEVKRISANGTELAYVEFGQGEPVIFVHGGLQDYRM